MGTETETETETALLTEINAAYAAFLAADYFSESGRTAWAQYEAAKARFVAAPHPAIANSVTP